MHSDPSPESPTGQAPEPVPAPGLPGAPGVPGGHSLQVAVSDTLKRGTPGRVPFSVEFMPPRDDAAEARLWSAAEAFHDLGASFVSVTYGAGGSSRQRTERVAGKLARKPLTTLLHMTLVGHTGEEIRAILREFASLGLTNLLALRGDPPGDPLGEWQGIEGGLVHAIDLIRLIRSLPECADFDIGIASFPEGHYRAASLEDDTRHTVEKLRAGASYSITQMFFNVEHYLRLRDRLAAFDPVDGAKPVIPGLMPITSLRSVRRQVELSGCELPREMEDLFTRVAAGDERKNAAAIRKVGIEVTTRMAERLIAEGAPDLHFMTMNNVRATQEVLHNLGMAPAYGPGLGQDAVR
ncbi:methylenetetrahydrofolate reductase [Corynebacterium provencense]|uniref:Methylenetetrahydrofolate reductase n=1 Tax=Corynebacterium provencense TaxID=1737425 RepID=A0A2Z3YMY9_9CORY|nr:methylenetetrahydrofolate reductase [Corynebacterium provencense]AWT26445.1 5,10-methylenetetrahydrofolate reductase [Corynebacterium provencense]MCI1256473.1 methylenetetrahydrofolate reductase [Corynebacterium provencense]